MKYHGIVIEGNKKFTKQTKDALTLIQKSKRDFNKAAHYLKKIKQAEKSWMDLENSQFNVGNLTAFYSVEWYAGTIVHDTYHYYLQNVKKFLWVPKNFRKHEQFCLNEQIRFLRKINAPQNLIKYCKETLKLKYWTTSYKEKHAKW
jgi:hypothetical protein